MVGRAVAQVLVQVLLEIDKWNLYGRVAYPKTHTHADVWKLLSWACQRRGILVNPAQFEPFGLTLLEAALCGLPVLCWLQ